MAMDPFVQSLALLRKGSRGVVAEISESADAHLMMGDVRGASIIRRLLEIGFVPGEAIEVIGEVRPGGDPIAVRIGNTIFALRRREAQPVLVRVESNGAPHP
jgi:ferrous iron transport protein A